MMQSLEQFRHISKNNFSIENEASWTFYAASRVNDILLLPLQTLENERDFLALSREDYEEFWRTLGFEVFEPQHFHPFECEIFAVEAADDANFSPQIERVVWPGAKFGDLMFARAGVVVKSGANFLDAKIAATSMLYDVFWRLHRRTEDLSMGWGSNSQWRTAFRRDYVYNDHFLFNVDGEPGFKQPSFLQSLDWNDLPERQFFASQKGDNDDLTTEEREELLTYRGFVKCPKSDADLWPYDDCLIVRRDAPL